MIEKKRKHLIEKPIKQKTNDFLLNILFNSKNFYGESLHTLNKKLLPFLYGTRHNYVIIDLKHTSIMLKRVLILLKNFIKTKKKILIIGNSVDIQFLINKNLIKKRKNILFLNNEWIHGLITNKKINILLNKNAIDLILVIKSSTNEKFLNQELSSLQIPIISFVNTNQDITNIHYPILHNSNNIKSLYSLIYLIRKLF